LPGLHRRRNRHQQETLIFWQSKPRWAQRAGSFAGASFTTLHAAETKNKKKAELQNIGAGLHNFGEA